MLLSICMIVKDEGKYLLRCLESLKPILEKVDSELLIADTGSTDNTVSIAKKFTDNVFSSNWCNDFSASRNSVIKRAKGDWLMTVDGDEIFEDVDQLITFFNSGEFKKYNSATFIQRNYNDISIKNSSDFNVARLTKRTDKTAYIGRIHEQFTTFGEPIKMLSVIADHFGYITQDNYEFIEQKSRRNLDLLFAELKENPKNYYCLYYLCITFESLDEVDNALKYCNEGLKYAVEDKNAIQYSLFMNKTNINYKQKNYLEAIKTINNYFNSKRNTIATDLEMNFLKAECSFALKDYGTAVDSYKKYIKIFGEYKSGMHRTIDTLQHSLSYINDASLQLAIKNLIISYTKINNYDAAVRETLSIFKTLMSGETCRDDNFAEIYSNTSSQYSELFREILEILIINENYKEGILKNFAECDCSPTEYIELMRLRYNYFHNALTKEAVQKFVIQAKEWKQYYADVICYALYFKLPLDELSFKAQNLNYYLFDSPYILFEKPVEAIYEYCKTDNIESEDVGVNLWLSQLLYWALTSKTLKNGHIELLLISYRKTSWNYLSSVYKEEVLSEENSCLLPQNLRIAFYCCAAAAYKDQSQTSQYIKCLKTILGMDNRLKKVIAYFFDELEKKREGIQSEFDQYAKVIKSKIISFIDNGKNENALEALQAYAELCPDDPEITVLKDKIKIE